MMSEEKEQRARRSQLSTRHAGLSTSSILFILSIRVNFFGFALLIV